MKLTKILPLLAIASLMLCGCKQLTPQGAATLTTAAVYGFGQNNPRIVETMRQIQPSACEIVKNPGSTVEDVVGVIENSGGVNADTKSVINVLLAIYQTSIATKTNQSETHPYLEAVFCPGWAGGLALLPGEVAGVGEPLHRPRQAAKWILVK